MWHLIRNAASDIRIHAFVGHFKKCMLGDYEVGEFQRKWQQMVDTFELHGNMWVIEMYANRSIWATALKRSNFFVGFRITSRCEGLHSES